MPPPRRAPEGAGPPSTSWAQLEDLKRAEPWTADILRVALDLAVERLVRGAWLAHDRRDPVECASGHDPEPLVARIEATAERLTVRLAVSDATPLASSARDCLEHYFAGEVTIDDIEVGGPFPEARLDLTYPVPTRLSTRL